MTEEIFPSQSPQNDLRSGRSPIESTERKASEEKMQDSSHENPGNSQEGKDMELDDPNTTDTNGVEKNDEESLEEELNRSQVEIQKLQDSWARERAEFVNFRKRVRQDNQRQEEMLIAGFASSLLPLLDNLDQVIAVQSSHEEVRKYVEGIEMIRQSFTQLLSEKKIQPFRPLNESFDPHSMEAISSEEREDLESDTVLEIYQTGYEMQLENGSHIIRPARVKVGKAVSRQSVSENPPAKND